MEKEIILLQKVLIGETNAQAALSQLLSCKEQKSINGSKISPIIRTLQALSKDYIDDFCGNLRQCLCYYPGSLRINEEMCRTLEKKVRKFGFVISENDSDYSLNITPQILPEIPDLASRFNLVLRKADNKSMGDGTLYRYFGYTHYLSLSQKMLMYFVSSMERNETMLACLPTGGGKSLTWEWSAISEQINGMVIVVVPTVALAFDHEKSSKQLYGKNEDSIGEIAAYKANLKETEKSALIRKIENGRISILYISPEALLWNTLKSSILDAATKGFVGMFVVDEAHLVAQWGIHFRSEFQLVASFRDKLEEASPNGLKTLLLSATLNKDDTATISKVFTSNVFTEFRADELRPEPEYYIHKCRNEVERDQLIDRLCAFVPRPLIIYASVPSAANDYYSTVSSSGYKRIGLFTGLTSTDERARLVSAWRDDKIDIMIATSAFGMGVDKPDIRTVITAYIPENISRFYQEVGRAGRDGFASLNYWLPIDSDWNIVDNLTKSIVLTEKLISSRWSALYKNSSHVSSNEVWLDMNAAHGDLQFTHTGEQNRSWNKDVVMFLVRCGLLALEDVEIISNTESRVLVRLKDIPVLESEDRLINTIAQFRDKERNTIDEGKKNVYHLMNDKEWCFSESFVEEFPYSVHRCAGCPSCRQNDMSFINSDSNICFFGRNEKSSVPPQLFGDDIFAQYCTYRSRVLISLNMKQEEKQDKIISIIGKLVRKGVNIFILPECIDVEPLLKRLAVIRKANYLLLTLSEAKKLRFEWLKGYCALFYNQDSKYNNRLYAFAEEYLAYDINNHTIHIASDNMEVSSKRKPISELMDCIINSNQLE